MSQTNHPDYSEFSNRELLEATAELDAEKFPIADRAQRALAQLEDDES
jgi:hypothetical protein